MKWQGYLGKVLWAEDTTGEKPRNGSNLGFEIEQGTSMKDAINTGDIIL